MTPFLDYELQRLYWNLKSFTWDNYLQKTGLQEELEELADYISVKLNKPAAKILDVGCASGALSILLAQKGFSVTGIDYSGLMIGKAKKKIADRKNLDITFYRHDVNLTLPFERDFFDLVVCRHSLFAALDTIYFAQELNSVCAKEGMVLIIGKNAGHIQESSKRKTPSRLIKSFVFFNAETNLTRGKIIEVFIDNGFHLIDERLTENNFLLRFKVEKDWY
jgi:2-polyprenyl-3-methyl-5-hydroxy-6-metoxy-1,4-benzoquinol methylase